MDLQLRGFDLYAPCCLWKGCSPGWTIWTLPFHHRWSRGKTTFTQAQAPLEHWQQTDRVPLWLYFASQFNETQTNLAWLCAKYYVCPRGPSSYKLCKYRAGMLLKGMWFLRGRLVSQHLEQIWFPLQRGAFHGLTRGAFSAALWKARQWRPPGWSDGTSLCAAGRQEKKSV